MRAVPLLIHSDEASSLLRICFAAVGMAMPMAARNSKELQARLLVALKVCTLKYIPPKRKQHPAAKRREVRLPRHFLTGM